MKRKFLTLFTLAVAFCGTFLSSCSDDDDNGVSVLTNGKAKVVLAIDMAPQASNGYLLPISDLISGTTASFDYAAETKGTSYLKKYGNWIFSVHSMDGSITKFSRDDNGGLVSEGTLQISAGTPMMGTVAIASDTKGYAAAMLDNKIIVFNPTTMQKTGEIDIAKTEYGVNGTNTPGPLGMIVNNGKLYVGCCEFTTVPMTADGAHILIIDVATDTPIKMIHDYRLSSATYFTTDMWTDENDDVYFLCYGSSGYAGQDFGFLKIDGSTDEFDQNFCISLLNKTIAGVEGGKLDFITTAYYAGDGEMYFFGYCPAFVVNPGNPDFLSERTNYCMKADLKAQTVEVLPLPRTNSYSAGITGYGDEVIFGLSTEKNGAGLFSYNRKTKVASTEPVVNVNQGSIMGIAIFD